MFLNHVLGFGALDIFASKHEDYICKFILENKDSFIKLFLKRISHIHSSFSQLFLNTYHEDELGMNPVFSGLRM